LRRAAVATDFVNVWAAGRLVLGGHAAAAYDWPTNKLAEDCALGHTFDGYYGWHYPPPFCSSRPLSPRCPRLSLF
jgi:hypothetical protein